MNREDCTIGQGVTYRPYPGAPAEDCTIGQGVTYRPYPGAPAEDGTVTELREGGAMVRYSALGPAKLTRYEDLTPITGRVPQ